MDLLYRDQHGVERPLTASCEGNGAPVPRSSGQNTRCIQQTAPPPVSNLPSEPKFKFSITALRFLLTFSLPSECGVAKEEQLKCEAENAAECLQNGCLDSTNACCYPIDGMKKKLGLKCGL